MNTVLLPDETAVPVFAAGPDSGITETRRVASWEAFTQAMGGFEPTRQLHVALRSYFENGGGPCYVSPTARWAEDIPSLEDATLLVAAGQDIQALVLALCTEGRPLFALLDGPRDALPDNGTWTHVSTSHAAVYYPWLGADWAHVPIPPSATVAGSFCTTDRHRGFWFTPTNLPLLGGVRPLHPVSDEQQAMFSGDKPLNMIRERDDRGALVCGVRTLEGHAAWRYIAVRRSVGLIQRDLHRLLGATAREASRQVLRSAIESYLERLWKRGGLAGGTAQDAFFIQMDPDTHPALFVGLALARGGEFIALRFTPGSPS
ncbi:hypothetical protein [Melittangium boletus]|uniref:hypothetical protein n=1 Tax=Melittangium boletus TaxID=83453 RepID=UPI003DA51AA2